MSQNQVKILQEKVDYQKEEICHLKEKLNSLNKDIATKNALQEKLVQLQQTLEEVKATHKQSNDELSSCIKCQNKKLEKAEINMTSLRADNRRLNDVNNCLTDQLKTFQRNEQRFIGDIEKLETLNKNLEKELNDTKVSIWFSLVIFNMVQNN